MHGSGSHRSEDFRSAIAQWRLALRTELKRTSSLPSAMFDACDPMLETRLAETAEAMLACLQQPAPEVASSRDNAEVRIEQVNAAEMCELPRRIAAVADDGLDLDDGLAAEYACILTDTCCSATGQALVGAVQLLRRDFGLTCASDVREIASLLADRPAPPVRGLDDAACERIAAVLAAHPSPQGAPE